MPNCWEAIKDMKEISKAAFPEAVRHTDPATGEVTMFKPSEAALEFLNAQGSLNIINLVRDNLITFTYH